MCGITGMFPLNTKCELDAYTRKQLIMWYNTELLHHTIERGKDATGITVSFTEGTGEKAKHSFLCLKQPTDADDFFVNDGTEHKYKEQEDDANPVLVHHKILEKELKFNFIIGHTRRKTIGTEYNVNNNHPIIVKNIVGIQNGGVDNHDRIFEKHPEMVRQGEVDSEAIMQLLALDSNDKALDWDSINYVNSRIEGPRAVLAYNMHHPSKVIFFRNTERPMEMYYLEELGAILVCSQTKYMYEIKKAYSRLRLTNKKFPKINYKVVNIYAGEGGVIDVTKKYDGKSDLKSFLDLKNYQKVLKHGYAKNYKIPEPPKTVTPNRANSYAHKPEKKSVFGQKASTTGGDAKSTTAGSGNDTSTTEITDYTKYDEDYNNLHSMEATMVMDDTEDEVILGQYTEEGLRAIAFSEISESDYFEKEDTLFSRQEDMSKLVREPALNEKQSTTVIKNVYPEIFGDGFVAGAKFAENEAEENIENTEDYNNVKDKLDKATKLIANLKVFMMAALKAKGQVIDVGLVQGEASIEFSDELDELINKAMQHSGLDIEAVLNTMTNSDFESLRISSEKNKTTVMG
jgi:hypothetical protein